MTLQMVETEPLEDARRMGHNFERARVARVLLVDDHALMRMGLASAIVGDATLTVCGEAPTAAKGIEMYRALRPDRA